MAGNGGYRKTRNKARCYHKHGYNYWHLITCNIELNRARKTRRATEPMFESVQEAFSAAKKRK